MLLTSHGVYPNSGSVASPPPLVPLNPEEKQLIVEEISDTIKLVVVEHDAALQAINQEIEEIQRQNARLIEELAKHTGELVDQRVDLYRQRDECCSIQAALDSKKAQLLRQLDEAKQLVAEGQAQIESGLEKKVHAEQLFAEAAEHGKEASRLMESAARHKENAAQHRAYAALLRSGILEKREHIAQIRREISEERERIVQLRESAAQHRTSAALHRASAAAKMNPVVCKYLFETFFGQKCPVTDEVKEQFFLTHVSNKEVCAVKDPNTGKPILQINNSTPLVQLSQQYPKQSICNLSRFKLINVEDFVRYLASPECPLKKIILNINISPEMEQAFNSAAVLRGGSLEVKVMKPAAPTGSSSSSSQP